ncbi:hypothetical protein SELMODRAFT_402446 [Selaginella moellendorffii]|uniref:Dirigent protein n=1 Tax=Selaginella moellendorffii TaxID=88036 RepID=D8QQN5_SELML|nr:dirigent protein 13 [Selaginella moellendorffii]XP_002967059.1 dirigent protein 13 [Selaginella moellendorffii]EFJ31658.1 hypothetical protein SELMODRAFT_408427 [Selaginella moellendorffii]EFJ38487.1 hypothetical protein SELMODRAFT_402446 [Selaginella moellendorffii]|eukprot:XP_002960948.1 dirigent protein 13 [Selaginella moellendorffii]
MADKHVAHFTSLLIMTLVLAISSLDLPPISLLDCCCGLPKNFVFYSHIIRSPANSSQIQSERAILGSTSLNPNFTAGYGAVFNNRLTLTPSYESQEIGRVKGTFFVPVAGSLVTYNSAVVFSTPFYNGSYVSADGLFDFSLIANDLPVFGGTGDLYFSKGRQVATQVLAYAGGANMVLKHELFLKVSKLDSCSLGLHL